MEKIDKNDVVEAQLPACSVELVATNQHLAVGCYELVDGETSERKGALELYSVSEDEKLVLGRVWFRKNQIQGVIVEYIQGGDYNTSKVSAYNTHLSFIWARHRPL